MRWHHGSAVLGIRQGTHRKLLGHCAPRRRQCTGQLRLVHRQASNDPVFELHLRMPDQPGRRASPKIFLRVVRETDLAIEADCTGCMVTSSRMADVCAELDRMALRAAARSES